MPTPSPPSIPTSPVRRSGRRCTAPSGCRSFPAGCRASLPATARKRPYLSHWQPLQEALVPQAQFERWYGPNGEHAGRGNMGLITGRCSAQRLRDRSRRPQAPRGRWRGGTRCWRSRTAGSTWRPWSSAPAAAASRSCSWLRPAFVVPTIKTSIGVDIRGQGGFAVLPPSLHESGQHYDWLPGRAPWEIAIEVAPDWLLEAVADLAEAHGGRVEFEIGHSDQWPGNPAIAGHRWAHVRRTSPERVRNRDRRARAPDARRRLARRARALPRRADQAAGGRAGGRHGGGVGVLRDEGDHPRRRGGQGCPGWRPRTAAGASLPASGSGCCGCGTRRK